MSKYYLIYKKGDTALVSRGNMYNHVNREGKLISKEWFRECGKFNHGLAPVSRGLFQWNYIKKDGSFLLDKWYTYCGTFRNEGLAVICQEDPNNHKESVWFEYLINTKGEILNNIPLLGIGEFHNGIAVVRNVDNKANLMNVKGEILLPEWLDNIHIHNNMIATVEVDNMFNFIDLKQENFPLLCSKTNFMWCSHSFDFNRMCIGIYSFKTHGMKYNFINEKGELISPLWFDKVFITDSFSTPKFTQSEGELYPSVEVMIVKNGVKKYNYIGIDGNPLYKVWFERD